jgi:two-component system, chemotaxis family, CheB/CheR fusion protein
MSEINDSSDHIIAGIGASADGINAMEVFFSNLPESTGITFVVIQHLSPDHTSILPEILQRKTRMKVLHIEDKSTLLPDHVYVLPAGYDVTMSNNRFRLQKYSKNKKGLHLPIDLFFRTLATCYKSRSAAILLSGTGSDGCLGIKEIKNYGGLVMVQDPKSAKFKSMPQNAIDTGLVEKVATPEELPGLLLEFKKKCVLEGEPIDDDGSYELMKKLFMFLNSRTGYDFSGYKKNTVHRRIRRRMTLHQIENFRDYVFFLEKDPEEVNKLFRELLIGVTSFFRNREAFDVLEKKVFPQIIHSDRKDPLRLWVAACSSGEEVYSLAILANEFMASLKLRIDMQFFATDIDENALEVARRGRYKQNIEPDVPGNLLKKYFHKIDDMYEVHKDIRDMITFARHSTIKDPPYSKLDLVSCRNFLIYLDSDIQKHVLNTFHYALHPGGFLFLGQSESQPVKDDLFEPVNTKSRIYLKKENKTAAGDFISRVRRPEIYGMPSDKPLIAGKVKITLKEFAEKTALKEFMNPFLVVDHKGEIQYSLGKCDLYFGFHVGEPNQNIVNLAREGLKIPISNALRKIATEKKPVKYSNLTVKTSNGDEVVGLYLNPVTKQPFSHLVTVLIEPYGSGLNIRENRQDELHEIKGDSEEYIRNMEQELQETRDYLNNVIEELETSNEELLSSNEESQSTNEELQSANEELETSREEMQSLNEELETSNLELQRKVEEITNINNDLNNFLQSTHIGILFLDRDLKIRRFSRQIKNIVNLKESDNGRSIRDFDIQFLEGQLEKDIKHVLDNLRPVEKEITRDENQYFWMRILPYRTLDNRIDGVVITFTDISEKYRVQKIIEESERWRKYKYLFHQMEHGFALYKAIRNEKNEVADFKLVEANQAFENIMQIGQDETRHEYTSGVLHDKDYRNAFIRAGKKVLAGHTYQEERFINGINRYLNILYFSHEEGYVAIFVQDITSEKTEMKARVHLASIVESSDDAIFSESTEGEILSWNDGAVQLYGYSENEALRLMSHDLYFNPEDSEDRNMITEVKKGLKVKNQEAAHKGKDGRMLPVSVTKSPIRDDKGRIIAISNIVKDITSTKEREEELVRAKETTEQMAGLKSMFLANMSHEIRTPLNSILGFADMLKREIIEGKPGRYVDNINNSGKQLLHLINDIVDVSRIDAGELPIHLSSVNICELMRRTKEQFEGYATENQNTDLDFRLKLPESEGDFFIVADEHRLQQILKNLLSNAFKYTSEGIIEFGFEFRNRKNLLFFVCDTGTGISSENHEKIFDRFQQVENSPENSKKVIRGTGLGLAIARGLAERLGGKMWVNSILGKGSVFYFTIPYKEGESVNDALGVVAEETVRIPRFEGKKILIADDDPYSLEMLRIMLEDTKISMYVATDGHQVMDIYNKEEVDILLLDIRMPGKDGYELAKNIRIDNPRIPMIAQSAFAMPEQIKKSLDMGFNRHLVKPLNRDTLYSSLEAYLKRVP